MPATEIASRRDPLAHWAWAIPILLLVTFFAAQQINLYPPGPDEFFGMYFSGWLVDAPYTLQEVANSVISLAPDHVLGHHYLLNIWGRLAGFDIVLGRVLGVFFGLLTLAIVYRLGRDFVAPVAALFSVIILASNAFYNIYVPYTRMYSQVIFLAALAFWLYLRMISRPGAARIREAIALGLLTFIMLNFHPYSITLPLTLGIYHLFFVKKDRSWWLATASVCIALLLFMPYALTILAEGHAMSAINIANEPLGSWQAYAPLFIVLTNGQPLLAALAFIGLALTEHRYKTSPSRYLIPALLVLLLFGILGDNTGYVTTRMRFHFPLWPPFLLFFSAGFYGLYRMRRWAALLILLWIAASVSYRSSEYWIPYISVGHTDIFASTPWQLISRQAEDEETAPLIVGYRVYHTWGLHWPSRLNYSQREHYFDSRGVTWKDAEDTNAFKLLMNRGALIFPKVWTVLQTSLTSGEEIAAIESFLRGLDYHHCDTVEMGIDARVYKHVRNGYDCGG